MTADLVDHHAPIPFDHEVLANVQNRVLWLATSMIHHANNVRSNASGIKVGGHQASSASMTSIMTALYFGHLRADDRVSVKPHASPVVHAINYLLGRLDEDYLTELRAFGGLQSYPSRTKDPDPIDFSTGSVGIGATATIWSALAQRFVSERFDSARSGRHVALLGDAELDEGAIWEAIIDPMVPNLNEVLWIVDLNRQSLDRVIPNVVANRMSKMFDAAGWQTITLKYGRKLDRLMAAPGGEHLRTRIDEMGNEEYQSILRSPMNEVRERLLDRKPSADAFGQLVVDLSDAELAEAVADLGGHDLVKLSNAIAKADCEPNRPTIIFAYTIKAWGLPTRGHPGNHSAVLSPAEWENLAVVLDADSSDPWAVFPHGSPERDLCDRVADRMIGSTTSEIPVPPAPIDLGRPHKTTSSTQQVFGRVLADLAREAPEVAERVVTVSPDVASSTNLGGWINRVGVWNPKDRHDWFGDEADRLINWNESRSGQHIELGIAEGNLVGLLGELGVTWSRTGRALVPIGTIYDPFVTRALEQWSFGIYAGGQSILVGTPSGITLAPEGGAHQSIITPSIGIEQPGCIAWEPCFGQDLEWTLLNAINQLGRVDGSSSYFRLTTRPIEQRLSDTPTDPGERERRRRHAIAGGYIVRASPDRPRVTLVGMGAVMPEVLAAATQLAQDGIPVDTICLTSADLVYRAFRARSGLTDGNSRILDVLFPVERRAPVVTVLDGHPHTLSFIANINAVHSAHLGVDDFGQVGEIDELYRFYGLDTETIVGAAWDLFEGPLQGLPEVGPQVCS